MNFMPANVWYIGAIVVYMIVMIGISYVVKSKVATMEDYGKATGRFGTFMLTVVSVGAWVGGGGLVGLCAWSYEAGLSQWWGYSLAYIGAIPMALFFTTRIRKLNFYTIPDFFQARYPDYGGVIKYPSAFFFLIRNVTMLGVQFNAIAFLMTVMFGVSHWVGVVIAAAMIASYVVISGMMSVVVTNFVQSFFQSFTPIIALVIVVKLAGGWGNVHDFYAASDNLSALSLVGGVNWWRDVFSYFLSVGIFFMFISDQSDWQRINTARDGKTARRSMISATFTALPFLLIPCLVGVVARVLLGPDQPSNEVFYIMIKNLLSPGVGALLIVGALATVMSCASSFMFASAMNLSNDIIGQIPGIKGDEKKMLAYSRYCTLLACLLGVILAVLIKGILDLWLWGLLVCACGLVIPYVFAWFSKTMNTAGALGGMILGGGIAIAWSMAGNPFGLDAVWIGLPASLVGCLVFKFFGKTPSHEVVERTYYFGEQFKNMND